MAVLHVYSSIVTTWSKALDRVVQRSTDVAVAVKQAWIMNSRFLNFSLPKSIRDWDNCGFRFKTDPVLGWSGGVVNITRDRVEWDAQGNYVTGPGREGLDGAGAPVPYEAMCCGAWSQYPACYDTQCSGGVGTARIAPRMCSFLARYAWGLAWGVYYAWCRAWNAYYAWRGLRSANISIWDAVPIWVRYGRLFTWRQRIFRFLRRRLYSPSTWDGLGFGYSNTVSDTKVLWRDFSWAPLRAVGTKRIGWDTQGNYLPPWMSMQDAQLRFPRPYEPHADGKKNLNR
jgi:hypothetical protein